MDFAYFQVIKTVILSVSDTVCFRLALLYIYLHCHLEITTGVKTCSVADRVEFHSYINSINTDG